MSTVITDEAKSSTATQKTWNDATETWDESVTLFEPDETWDTQYGIGLTVTNESKNSSVTPSNEARNSTTVTTESKN